MTSTPNIGLSELRRWRRYKPALRLASSPTNLAAFLNVALIVAAFFLFDSPFVLKPGIMVELPVSDFAAGATAGGSMIVTLTQEGMAFFDDERVPIEELGAAMARVRQRRKDLGLIVEADYRVPYGTVVRVMKMAADAGIRRVNLATSPSVGKEVLPWEE